MTYTFLFRFHYANAPRGLALGKATVRVALVMSLLALMTAVRVEAQAEQSTPQVATFRVLAPIGQTQEFYYNDGDKDVRVVAGTALSRDFEAPPNGSIDFFRLVENADAPPLRVKEATINLPGLGPYLIIVANRNRASDNHQRKLEFAVIDDSLDAHPINTARVLNLSSRQIAAKIQQDQALIEPGKNHLFAYQAKGNKTRMQVAVYDAEDSEWKLMISGSQVMLDQARSTIVIVNELPTRETPNPEGLALYNLVDASVLQQP